MKWSHYLADDDPNKESVQDVLEAQSAVVGQPVEDLWWRPYLELENTIELHGMPARYIARELARLIVDLAQSV